MSRKLLLGIFVLILLGSVASAQDFDKYQYTTTDLGGQVWLLSGAGGNVAVCVGQTGVLVVDTDYRPMAGKLAVAIAALEDRPARFVVDTHWHFDHVGGNESFARAGALVIAHRNVRKRMAAGQTIALIDETIPPAAVAALPALCFADSLFLSLGDAEVEVIHLPLAHTDGDAVVRFKKANVIHAGDIFFNGGYPFIDISSGGTINGVIAAVDRILAMCDEETQIIPGHGPIAHASDLRTYRDMLDSFRSIIAAEMARGHTLDEIRAAHPTAALDEKYGSISFSPEMFTEMVYRSLPRPN
jgi:cyclase